MRIFLKIVVVAFNLVILYLAFNWISKENFYEPLIVIVGQLASLLSLGLEARRNATFKNIDGGTYDVTHKAPGDVKVEDAKNGNIKYTQD